MEGEMIVIGEKVYFKKLHAEAREPVKAYSDLRYPDAGWDLFALRKTVLEAGKAVLIPTGIAIELPEGSLSHFFEAQIRSRSGLRLKGIFCPVGTIDAGYRGDVGCIMVNITDKPYTIEKGEKMCQLVVMKLPRVEMVEATVLKSSDRGGKGFGSSGK